MELADTFPTIGDTLVGVVLRRDVQFRPFDTTASCPLFQIQFGSRRVVVNDTTKQCLEFLGTPRTFDELDTLVATLKVGIPDGKRLLKELQESPLREALQQYPSPLESSIQADEISGTGTSETGRPKRKKADYLLIQIPVIGQEKLKPVTSVLSGLFSIKALWFTLPLIFISHIVFMALWFSRNVRHGVSIGEWFLLAGLVYSALVFHELGHSSACHRFKCKHGDIGVGLYLVWPIFYADVSDSWSLPRLQRAVIDIGGLYFHLLFSSVCVGGWLLSHSNVLALTVSSLLMMTVLNLNPFLRFDGYWLMTDLIGLTNLRFAISELRHYLMQRLMGVPDARRPMIFNTAKWIRYLFLGYCASSIVFSAYVIWRVVHFIPKLISVPAALIASSSWEHSHWQVVFSLIKFMVSVLGIGLLCKSVLQRWVKGGQSAWKTVSNSSASAKIRKNGRNSGGTGREVIGDDTIVGSNSTI